MSNGCTDVPTCYSHNEPPTDDDAGGDRATPILDAADSRPLANQDAQANGAIFVVVMVCHSTPWKRIFVLRNSDVGVSC